MEINKNRYQREEILSHLDIAIDQSRAVYEAWLIYQRVFSLYQIKQNESKKNSVQINDTLERNLMGVKERDIEKKERKNRQRINSLLRKRPLFMFVAFCFISTLLSPYYQTVPRSRMAMIEIIVLPVCLVFAFYILPYFAKKRIDEAKAVKTSVVPDDRITYVPNYPLDFWNGQKNEALDKYTYAQAVLDHIKNKGIIDEQYFNLAALCSIREYLLYGRCDELEGANGAYRTYSKEKSNNNFVEQLEKYDTGNKTIIEKQRELYEELLKAKSTVEPILREYDELFNSNIKYENVDESAILSEFFPERTRYYTLRGRIERNYLA